MQQYISRAVLLMVLTAELQAFPASVVVPRRRPSSRVQSVGNMEPIAAAASAAIATAAAADTAPANEIADKFITKNALLSVDSTDIAVQRRGALSMTIDELAAQVGGRGRARLIWDHYRLGVDPAVMDGAELLQIYNRLPSCRRQNRLGADALQRLAALYPHGAAGGRVENGVARLINLHISADTTTKLLLQLHDGLQVETVIIPWHDRRSTLCVSSQVGCRQACTFCATGRMGRLRNLSSDEILAQVFWAHKVIRQQHLPPLSNVVFMGMGEPADNVEHVRRAVDILTHRALFQLSAQKVTVSTVAPTPRSFAAFANAPCVLAWSVHAADDDVRRRLVPTTRYSMYELQQGLITALRARPPRLRTTMLEVALLANVNDGMHHADALAVLADNITQAVPGCKLMVNLIPWNDISGNSRFPDDASASPSTKNRQRDAPWRHYQTPSAAAIRTFQEHLWSHHVHAHVRMTRGDDQAAACGQLATTTTMPRNRLRLPNVTAAM